MLLWLALACSTPTPPPPAPAPDPVAERVAAAEARLAATEGGALVWKAIAAHGGLRGWLSTGHLAFVFDYQPVDKPERRMLTRNTVDVWSARVRQEEVAPAPEPLAHLGWNGETAWITPDREAFPSSARFWALTPYYFVGMPWVLADPGTRFERLADAPLDGVPHHLVKVTYEAGTGDAPDDYYVLYLHPDTGRVGALRYVVSYPGFFPDGGHSPEKLMVAGAPVAVDGLWFAGSLDTYAWDAEAGAPMALVTEVDVRDHALGAPVDDATFDPPPGAVVLSAVE